MNLSSFRRESKERLRTISITGKPLFWSISSAILTWFTLIWCKTCTKFNSSRHKQVHREHFSCEDVFALYLLEVARKVNTQYYSYVLRFVVMLRESLNEYGKKPEEESQPHPKFYSEKNNALLIPKIANYLVTYYFSETTNVYKIPRNELVDLMRNFCHWLLMNNFTDIRLNLKPPQPTPAHDPWCISLCSHKTPIL